MISKASAPGKIILFGEHFVVHGTKAVLAAIDRRITVSSEATAEPVISIKSQQLGSMEIGVSQRGDVRELYPFEFLAKKMIGRFSHGGGIRVEIRSDIPHGVGLGSSSAACVAGAASISGLFARYGRREVCELAIEAERTIFEDTSGADCTVCTFGGIIEYGRGTGFERIRSEPGLNLIIANSGTVHSTRRVVAGVARFRDGNRETFEDLCDRESDLIRRAVTEIRREDPRALGRLMRENQGHLRTIGVSNGTLEKMVRIMDGMGYGSKITGAGGGGCVISVADEGAVSGMTKKLAEHGIRCFPARIDYGGLETF